jgi:hypothetical protein
MFSGGREKKRTPYKRRAAFTLEPFHPGLMARTPIQRILAVAQHAQLQLRILALMPMRLTLTTGEMAVKVAIVAEEATAMGVEATGVEVMDAEATGVEAATDRM